MPCFPTFQPMEELKPHFEAKSTEHGIALNKSFKIAAADFPMESFAGISALAELPQFAE